MKKKTTTTTKRESEGQGRTKERNSERTCKNFFNDSLMVRVCMAGAAIPSDWLTLKYFRHVCQFSSSFIVKMARASGRSVLYLGQLSARVS